jgi:hypothetical protein
MEIGDKFKKLKIYLLSKFLYCCVVERESSEISEYMGWFFLISNTGGIPSDRRLLWVLGAPYG